MTQQKAHILYLNCCLAARRELCSVGKSKFETTERSREAALMKTRRYATWKNLVRKEVMATVTM